MSDLSKDEPSTPPGPEQPAGGRGTSAGEAPAFSDSTPALPLVARRVIKLTESSRPPSRPTPVIESEESSMEELSEHLSEEEMRRLSPTSPRPVDSGGRAENPKIPTAAPLPSASSLGVPDPLDGNFRPGTGDGLPFTQSSIPPVSGPPRPRSSLPPAGKGGMRSPAPQRRSPPPPRREPDPAKAPSWPAGEAPSEQGTGNGGVSRASSAFAGAPPAPSRKAAVAGGQLPATSSTGENEATGTSARRAPSPEDLQNPGFDPSSEFDDTTPIPVSVVEEEPTDPAGTAPQPEALPLPATTGSAFSQPVAAPLSAAQPLPGAPSSAAPSSAAPSSAAPSSAAHAPAAPPPPAVLEAPAPRETSDRESLEELDPFEELNEQRFASQPEVPPADRKPPPPRRSAAPALPSAQTPRKKPWWETLFGDDFSRAYRPMTLAQLRREVDFIEKALAVAPGSVILDLGCGQGEISVELARRGYSMVGYDLSVYQLAMAGDNAQSAQQKINFLQGDMREMAFEQMFDAVVSWDTSFGYFEEEKNFDVLRRIKAALKPGGRLLLDVLNRDFVAREAPYNQWFEGDGCVCMDDMSMDWITNRLRVKRSIILDDGRSKELSYSVRLYGLSDVGRMLHEVGFRVTAVSGDVCTPGAFFGPASRRIIITANKP